MQKANPGNNLLYCLQRCAARASYLLAQDLAAAAAATAGILFTFAINAAFYIYGGATIGLIASCCFGVLALTPFLYMSGMAAMTYGMQYALVQVASIIAPIAALLTTLVYTCFYHMRGKTKAKEARITKDMDPNRYPTLEEMLSGTPETMAADLNPDKLEAFNLGVEAGKNFCVYFKSFLNTAAWEHEPYFCAGMEKTYAEDARSSVEETYLRRIAI